MATLNNKYSKLPYYQGMLELFVVMVILGAGTDFFVQYKIEGFNLYAKLNLLIIVVIAIATFLYWTKRIAGSRVFLIGVYTIILATTGTMSERVNLPSIEFEAYFVHAELILIVMSFTVGIFVHPKHKLVIASYNVLFTVYCASYTINYPIEKYVYYNILVFSAGFIGYVAFSSMRKMTDQLEEDSRLITTQNKELIEVNKFKDNLFKIIGHDLRTPIFQIVTLVELLEDDSTSEKEKKEYIKHMRTSTENATELLDSLLNWAREQKSGNQRIIIEKINIHDVVDRTLHLLEHNSSKKKIFLINATDEKQVMAFHSKSMETVLRNLISNAIKFSPDGETVTISSCVQNNFVKVCVADNGIGIDPLVVDKIDANVLVISKKGTENEVGTGNGLSICKKLIEKYKGRLEIRKTKNGTMASVYIPV